MGKEFKEDDVRHRSATFETHYKCDIESCYFETHGNGTDVTTMVKRHVAQNPTHIVRGACETDIIYYIPSKMYTERNDT